MKINKPKIKYVEEIKLKSQIYESFTNALVVEKDDNVVLEKLNIDIVEFSKLSLLLEERLRSKNL